MYVSTLVEVFVSSPMNNQINN